MRKKSRGWAWRKERQERSGKQRKLEEWYGKKEGKKGVGKLKKGNREKKGRK